LGSSALHVLFLSFAVRNKRLLVLGVEGVVESRYGVTRKALESEEKDRFFVAEKVG
jgi:hypothetical protein